MLKFRVVTQFNEDIDIWIGAYIHLCGPLIRPKGRGMLVVTVWEGECMPTFATLASCNDENLSRFGVDHAEAEWMRNVIRSYDEDTEVPVLTVGECEFRFELVMQQARAGTLDFYFDK